MGPYVSTITTCSCEGRKNTRSLTDVSAKMMKALGGGDDRLRELVKAVRDDYAEATRVMTFAQVMINLSSYQKIDGIGETTTRIMQREFL